jgi:hypothetical protein
MNWKKWFGTPQILKVIHNPTSACFFSFIIGFGLIILMFHRPIQTQRTLSMPVDQVESKIVKRGNTCYKFRAEDTKCENISFK